MNLPPCALDQWKSIYETPNDPYNPLDLDPSTITTFQPLSTLCPDIPIGHTPLLTSLSDAATSSSIHVKCAPLINPIHYAMGLYKEVREYNQGGEGGGGGSSGSGKCKGSLSFSFPQDPSSLVQPSEHPFTDNNAASELISLQQKINRIMNTSYVDDLFTALAYHVLKPFHFPHLLEYHGSFSATQHWTRVDLSGEYDYVQDSDIFVSQFHHLWTDSIASSSSSSSDDATSGSGAKKKQPVATQHFNLDDDDDDDVDDAVVCDDDDDDDNDGGMTCMKPRPASEVSDEEYEIQEEADDDDDDEMQSTDSQSYENIEEADAQQATAEEDDDDEEEEDDVWQDCSSGDDDDDDDDDENRPSPPPSSSYSVLPADQPSTNIYFKSFPVRMIFMEKCVEVVDQLFVRGEMDEVQSLAMFCQILMILATYKRAFGFTHNDLHTNNVMYVRTTRPYLYYQIGGRKFRVPTFGRIYKIIDFGRSIFHYHSQRFCCDSYAAGEDAEGHYNCEPFVNPAKPIREPNPSFDTFRFAVSLIGALPSADSHPHDPFVQIMHHVCHDKHGKHIAVRENGTLRDLDFKIFKYAAKMTDRGDATDLLTLPQYSFFDSFLMEEKDAAAAAADFLFNIDTLPSWC